MGDIKKIKCLERNATVSNCGSKAGIQFEGLVNYYYIIKKYVICTL